MIAKFIFLDIDGPLNAGRSDYMDPGKYGHHFDEIAVRNLGIIIDKTNAKIVISSSWRHLGLTKLREIWRNWNLPGEIFGCTPGHWGDETVFATRGDEIKQWLVKNASEPYTYVVIDDMGDDEALEEQKSLWITVNPHCGIDEIDANTAISILNANNKEGCKVPEN